MPSDADKIRAFDLLDALMQEECLSVLIHNHNPEFDGPNNIIEVERFAYMASDDYTGDSLLSCLEQAVEAKEARDAR